MNDFMKNVFSGASSLFGATVPDGTSEGQAKGLVSSLLDHVGGVEGLLDQAEQHGLGDKVRSWISTHDDNLPISPEQIQKLIPTDRIDMFAAAHGLPAGAVTAILAHMLPGEVDKKTPDGTATPTT